MEIKGHEYQIGKLNARQQLHLVRKLSPLFAVTPPLKSGASEQERENHSIGVFKTIAENLSDMKKEDVDYVLTLCLSVVKRLENNQYTFIQSPGTDRLMFPDIDEDMDTMIRLVVQVVEVNLGSFLASGPLLSLAVG